MDERVEEALKELYDVLDIIPVVSAKFFKERLEIIEAELERLSDTSG